MVKIKLRFVAILICCITMVMALAGCGKSEFIGNRECSCRGEFVVAGGNSLLYPNRDLKAGYNLNYEDRDLHIESKVTTKMYKNIDKTRKDIYAVGYTIFFTVFHNEMPILIAIDCIFDHKLQFQNENLYEKYTYAGETIIRQHQKL